MNTKKIKVLTYILSGLIPVIIFIIAMIINKTYPFGDSLLNIYDSKDQYSSILLTIARGIKNGNIFYSMNGGLGINLYANAAYYGTGILNIFSIFANAKNYMTYSTIMILVRFVCLGLSMCFYLSKKNLKPVYIIALSISYALMGFTSTYYYNYIWMDSIILLPLVIYGLEKLIFENRPMLYILFLSLSIISNFYIGYMIGIFCIMFFIYQLIIDKNQKKEKTKMFIISTVLSISICMVVLLPVFFALLEGKVDVFENITYLSFDKNILSLFYSLTPGNYKAGDQAYGHALIYTSLFVFVNSILYFFNKKISKKEKLYSLSFIIIFIISISFNLFNYGWHMFAKPIWFVYRFSFLFSFLLIYLSSINLKNINNLQINKRTLIIITSIIIILIEFSALYKLKFNLLNESSNDYLGYYIVFSFIVLIIYFIKITNKSKKAISFMLTILLLELLLNTIVSVHENSLEAEKYNKSLIGNYINISNKIKEEDISFYRTDIFTSYLVNDGLMYNLYSLDYISSLRNNNINNYLVNTGLFNQSHLARVGLGYYDLPILNLYGVKYIIHQDGKSYDKIKNSMSLGFTTKASIKKTSLSNKKEYAFNLNTLYSSFIDQEVDMYNVIKHKDFKTIKNNKEYISTYNFHSNGNYLIHLSNVTYSLTINGKTYNHNNSNTTFEINKNDYITIKYIYDKTIKKDEIKIILLDLDKYNEVIKTLKNNTNELYNIKINENNHIVSGDINVDNDYNYLFTTIGYEKGMKVYVDGKKIKPDILFDALIGLELSKGTHTIVIDYIPKGFYEGVIISTIGSILTIFYYIRNKKRFL